MPICLHRDLLTKRVLATISLSVLLSACSPSKSHIDSVPSKRTAANHSSQGSGKPVIYQVFTRLFGNQKTRHRAWGTIEQNGVGKFNDFTDEALTGISELGTSYIWYTGVLHHALVNDYSAFGISNDDPDVVKGRAGSPYAIKDYYNVNPDLASNPTRRIQEFESLIKRTHEHKMKVIIDIVPNHVARQYESTNLPVGQRNLGADDDKTTAYHKHNNFYYVEDQSFTVPDMNPSKKPLGGEQHELSDGDFREYPAKWTGNGSRLAKPRADDWYETVKVNYGVRPDGQYDFPKLDDNFRTKSTQQHYQFWQQQDDLPDSWYKMEAIAHFWISKGVDGFRFDMAELVPVEFWSFLNASIKHKNPDFLLLAEVYNPGQYRDYIELGRMDYLYDKVDFYDSLKNIMQGNSDTQVLDDIQQRFADIESHLLHFLENHDEQRIASPEFVGNPIIGKPALAVSALISRSPTLIYFGQDVGEDGSERAGFGEPSRTSIFDYIGVPAHQRWMNEGRFDGGQLSPEEDKLREFYKKVLAISAHHEAMNGEYIPLHSLNMAQGNNYSGDQFSFMRATKDQALVVITNFTDQTKSYQLVVDEDTLPSTLKLKMSAGIATDLLSKQQLSIKKQKKLYHFSIQLGAYDSKVISIKDGQ